MAMSYSTVGTAPGVLLIEDEALILMTLEDMVAELGYRVVAAVSSLDGALACLEAESERPAVAIVDVNLGGQSALPALQRLRDCGIPFILTTGYGRESLAGWDVDAPLVSKPYTPEDLKTALDRVLDRPARSAVR